MYDTYFHLTSSHQTQNERKLCKELSVYRLNKVCTPLSRLYHAVVFGIRYIFLPQCFFLFIYNWIFLSIFVLVFRRAHQHLNADTILFNIYSAGKINFRQTKMVINVNNFNCRTHWRGDEDSYSLGRSVFANRLRIPYAYVLVKRR